MNTAVAGVKLPSETTHEVHKFSTSIRERLSEELVVAFIGPVASGVSSVARLVKKRLESEFRYDVPEIIKVSDFIRTYSSNVSEGSSLDQRIQSYQDAGNLLRANHGASILARLAVKRISEIRHKDGFEMGAADGMEIPKSVRRIYLIDSLKHPEEVDQLKEIYGNLFWLVGVFAPDYVREARLMALGVDREKIYPILKRDQGEASEFGQKVRKAFSRSDFFIRNATESIDNLNPIVNRFLDVLFGAEIRSPTVEESAMFHATTAASKSACMSRQVGAALVGSDDQLISVGWNDVPKFGGGLYEDAHMEQTPSDNDHRCYRWRERICHNDNEKAKIESKIVSGIRNALTKKAADAPLIKGAKQIPVTLSDEEIRGAIESSGISSLIEFSRAIHAEMSAILAVARDKRHSLRDSTLVVTTYPCHNCARHIVAAGVVKVIYIEPYEKSLATHLHPDSISEDERDTNKCHFIQFEGFAPRHILDLFQVKGERKKLGKLLEVDRKEALPIYRRHLDSFTVYEDKVVSDVAQQFEVKENEA
ncbi:MAG: deoxycytidylate deaminase-related protein [Rhodanobacteraceae bacterium]|jgi:deoxycytidylate deaminase|nr:MAG: deoxycytidylate deaminase-related protein [Rhodanobacteraceae bacterium]